MKKNILRISLIAGIFCFGLQLLAEKEQVIKQDWRSGFSPGKVQVEDGWIFIGAGGGMFIRKYKTLDCCVESNSNSACDFASDKLSVGCNKEQNLL